MSEITFRAETVQWWRERECRKKGKGYQNLCEVSGIGKPVRVGDKYDRQKPKTTIGRTVDEVCVSYGEQKYFVQLIQLEPGVTVDEDDTRFLFRIGYYTQRSDGRFGLGSQWAPYLTRAELQELLDAMFNKNWLSDPVQVMVGD